MSKWDYLIEADKQIRDAERSGEIGQIIKAYKRLGLPGGGKAAFGRDKIGGWNRRAAKGFNSAASANAFVEAALSRNYAVIFFYPFILSGEILFFARGQKDPSKRFVWGGRLVNGRLGGGKLSKSQATPKIVINNTYENFEHGPVLAVVPRRTLPKPLRTGEGLYDEDNYLAPEQRSFNIDHDNTL